MAKLWNTLTLEGALIGALVSLFFILPGKFNPTDEVLQEIKEEKQIDIAYQRCGQYGLNYFEADNGFYNCIRKDR